MRKLALSFLLVAIFALAACGGSTSTGTGTTGGSATNTPSSASATDTPSGASSATTISMGGSSFTAGTSITVKAGQAVTFDDPNDGGGIHNLVTGTKGTFKAEAGAPSEFASQSGINFNPGDNKMITFSTPGTYDITCTIHPSMQATITVTQ